MLNSKIAMERKVTDMGWYLGTGLDVKVFREAGFPL